MNIEEYLANNRDIASLILSFIDSKSLFISICKSTYKIGNSLDIWRTKICSLIPMNIPNYISPLDCRKISNIVEYASNIKMDERYAAPIYICGLVVPYNNFSGKIDYRLVNIISYLWNPCDIKIYHIPIIKYLYFKYDVFEATIYIRKYMSKCSANAIHIDKLNILNWYFDNDVLDKEIDKKDLSHIIKLGNYDLFNKALQISGGYITTKILHTCIKYGHYNIILKLLETNVKITNYTIGYIIRYGNKFRDNIVSLLKILDERGFTLTIYAISKAVQYGFLDVLEYAIATCSHQLYVRSYFIRKALNKKYNHVIQYITDNNIKMIP